MFYSINSDGTYVELGPITEAEFLETDTDPEDLKMIHRMTDPLTMEIHLSAYSVRGLWKILGISNNWLKMHGYPMIRRRAFFQALKSTKQR